jgi:deaminated glutathione amidase
MDGVVPEVPRTVAVRGARLLLNSLNSFALDEAEMHIPIRAAENRAWVVASCKVGPLLPPDRVAEFSKAMGVPAELLRGAGESQIVDPTGTVVAKAPRDGDAMIWADIDMARSGAKRPDGTDVMASRRPSVYRALAEPTPPVDDHTRADVIRVAAATSIDDIAAAVASGAQLVVLPELALGQDSGDDIVSALTTVLASCSADPDVIVITSALEATTDGVTHCGVAVNSSGVVLRQPQLHRVERLGEVSVLGNELLSVDLPWGRLAIVVSDDIVYPEVARLAALNSVDVVAVPYRMQEEWELRFGLAERAAENRMCLIAASIGDAACRIVTLPPDFTLWAPSRERVFDGSINRPDVTANIGGAMVVGDIHPVRSLNRQISRNTDLVNGRPWQLCAPLAEHLAQ